MEIQRTKTIPKKDEGGRLTLSVSRLIIGFCASVDHLAPNISADLEEDTYSTVSEV